MDEFRKPAFSCGNMLALNSNYQCEASRCLSFWPHFPPSHLFSWLAGTYLYSGVQPVPKSHENIPFLRLYTKCCYSGRKPSCLSVSSLNTNWSSMNLLRRGNRSSFSSFSEMMMLFPGNKHWLFTALSDLTGWHSLFKACTVHKLTLWNKKWSRDFWWFIPILLLLVENQRKTCHCIWLYYGKGKN